MKRKGKGGSERQWEKWCDEKKRTEGKCKKKRKKKKKERYKETRWWKKCRRLAESFLAKNAGKNREEKARRRSTQPKVRWTLG